MDKKKVYYAVDGCTRTFMSMDEVNKFLDGKIGTFAISKHTVEPVTVIEHVDKNVTKEQFVEKLLNMIIKYKYMFAYWCEKGIIYPDIFKSLGYDSLSKHNETEMKCTFQFMVAFAEILLRYKFPLKKVKIKTTSHNDGICFVFPNFRRFISDIIGRETVKVPYDLVLLTRGYRTFLVLGEGQYSVTLNICGRVYNYDRDIDVKSVTFQRMFDDYIK